MEVQLKVKCEEDCKLMIDETVSNSEGFTAYGRCYTCQRKFIIPFSTETQYDEEMDDA